MRELIEKKAEYHKITGGEQDGYRLKIHFGIDRENAKLIRTKFQQKFSEIASYEEYQQPNFVVLVGDFKTKLEAFELLKKIQGDFQNSFIVRCKVRLR
ncbi:MAG: SPOR domain-containing protein [Bacteroidetes bacterium]|nr:SPOR domain-containing protein [Bacteroidota bacterium]